MKIYGVIIFYLFMGIKCFRLIKNFKLLYFKLFIKNQLLVGFKNDKLKYFKERLKNFGKIKMKLNFFD